MKDETATPPTDEERAAALLVQFKVDLATIYTSPDYAASVDVVITGLLDVAEGLLRRAVRLEPRAMPFVLGRLDAVRARVRAVVADPAQAGAETRKSEPTWH